MKEPTPTQSRIIWFALTSLAVALVVALLAGLVWALGRVLNLLGPVLWPLAVAAVVAYLLDPVVDFLEQRKVPRRRAIIIVFASAVLLLLGLGGAVVPRLVIETRELAHKVPGYAATIQERATDWIESSRKRFEFLNRPEAVPATNSVPATSAGTPGKDDVSKAAVSWLAGVLPKVGSWLLDQLSRVASWFGILAGIALVPVYCFYFLTEKAGIQRKWADYLPVRESQIKQEMVFVLTSINDYLIVFFRGQVLVAACDGVLYTIGFFAVGLNYALLLGLLAGALSIIPYLGPILTVIPATVLAAVQYRDWLHPLMVLGVFGVVQVIEGLVLSPRIIGDRVGLHPLTVIVAVMVGTTLLGGILGGILAIPLTAALRVLMFRYVWKKTE
jgi:predicted PurR-regulated permease PerM